MLTLSAQAATRAHSMRCGRRLIQPGDTADYVIAQCGEPSSRAYIVTDSRTHGSAVTERSEEEWIYNFGPRKFVRILRFKGNRLRSIKDGGKGY